MAVSCIALEFKNADLFLMPSLPVQEFSSSAVVSSTIPPDGLRRYPRLTKDAGDI
jgi:hypothetical protein